jgi:hypothetical protein
MVNKKTLLERLAEGPVIGDGGFVFALEKRGYVKAGPWTPEAAVEDPEAGKFDLQLVQLLTTTNTTVCASSSI